MGGFNILSAINAERSRVVSLFRQVYTLIPKYLPGLLLVTGNINYKEGEIMLKRFKAQVVNSLIEANSAIGMTSLLLMIASVSIALPTAVGLSFLADAGLQVGNKSLYQKAASASAATGLLGLAGLTGAILTGGLLSTCVLDEEEGDEQASTTTSTSQLEEEVVEISESAFVPKTRPEQIFTYYVTSMDGHPNLYGLDIARTQPNVLEPGKFEIIYHRLTDYQFQRLSVLFEVKYPQDKNLVGKYFNSRLSNPGDAIKEYLRLHYKYIEVKSSGQFRNACLDSCKGCANLHGEHKIVCGIYPYGWEGLDCPDKKLLDGIVLRQFEDTRVLDNLNQGLNDAEVIKIDDSIVVHDRYFDISYRFDFDGNRFFWSENLSELGKDATLVNYVNYFKNRKVVDEDFSTPEKIRELNKGLRCADVRVQGDKIVVYHITTRTCYYFKFNGQADELFNSFCPRELENNYNLVSLVDYLRCNKSFDALSHRHPESESFSA